MSRRLPLLTFLIYGGMVLLALAMDRLWFHWSTSDTALIDPQVLFIDSDLKVAMLVVAMLLGIVWSVFPGRRRAPLVMIGGSPLVAITGIGVYRTIATDALPDPTVFGAFAGCGSVAVFVGGVVGTYQLYDVRSALRTTRPPVLSAQELRSVRPSRSDMTTSLLLGCGVIAVAVGIQFGFGGWQFSDPYRWSFPGDLPVRTDYHWTAVGAAIVVRVLWPRFRARVESPGFFAIGVFLLLSLGHLVVYMPYRYYEAGPLWTGYLVLVGALVIFLSGAIDAWAREPDARASSPSPVVSNEA